MTRATIKEVAREAQVSTATVSRVLNSSGYASQEVKDRVYAAMEKLQYRPNAVARSLKQDRTYMIGVVIPDVSNPFFMSAARGIEDVVSAAGYHLLFCSSDERPDKESRLLSLLAERRADAVVLATCGGDAEPLRRMVQNGLPVVLIDRKLESPGLELETIAEDNVRGAYELTERLLSMGHRRIGVIRGSLAVSTGRERQEGFLQAVRKHGIEPEEDLFFDGAFTVQGGTEAARYFLGLSPGPTALLSFNNTMTFGALLEMKRRGIRPPKDWTVASYGEVEAALLLEQPGLIYARQQPYEMGAAAGEALLRLLGVEEPDGGTPADHRTGARRFETVVRTTNEHEYTNSEPGGM